MGVNWTEEAPMADTTATPFRMGRTHRIYAILLPIPILCFVGALLTDGTYQYSDGNLLWVNFSSWLLATGLLFGAIAGIVLLVSVAVDATLRSGPTWGHLGLLFVAWVVELMNAFVHTRDGWTAVIPTGLILSVIAVVLALASGWLWQSARYRDDGGQP
jgi:uncharacterized membrane protein